MHVRPLQSRSLSLRRCRAVVALVKECVPSSTFLCPVKKGISVVALILIDCSFKKESEEKKLMDFLCVQVRVCVCACAYVHERVRVCVCVCVCVCVSELRGNVWKNNYCINVTCTCVT